MLPESAFSWTHRTIPAAQAVAEDRLTDEQIAASVGVTKQTLERWKKHPEFQQRVAEIVEKYRQAVLSEGIADVVNRVKALGDRWGRMQQVIEARGKRYRDYRAKYDDDPVVSTNFIPDEAETGLVILIETPTKEGLKREWSVDTSLLSEMRATEKQAAIEVGQWQEKKDITSGGNPLSSIHLLALSEVSDEDLERRIEAAERRKAKAPLQD
jgi:hypothetical protein